MPKLNNPYLNPPQLIFDLATKLKKGHLHIQRVKQTIIDLYFPKLSLEEAMACLETDIRFADYPDLKDALVYLLRTEQIDLEALETLKNKITKKAWQASASETEFQQFNTQYDYFEQNEASLALYKNLVEASRAIIVLIEKNNTPDDTMAYEYAYKMMALFIDDISTRDTLAWLDHIASKMLKLTTTFDTKITHPYHDALLTTRLSLPLASELTDRAGWTRLIEAHGVKGYEALGYAAHIESINDGYAPQKLNAAKALLAQCEYSRSAEDSDFATLCHAHRVPESCFNACLDYMQSGWPKKTEDNLPDKTITHGKFTWSKLPVTDKRALILGDITDCCQSIGGNSDACVRDATSLPNNG